MCLSVLIKDIIQYHFNLNNNNINLKVSVIETLLVTYRAKEKPLRRFQRDETKSFTLHHIVV